MGLKQYTRKPGLDTHMSALDTLVSKLDNNVSKVQSGSDETSTYLWTIVTPSSDNIFIVLCHVVIVLLSINSIPHI